MTEVSKYFPLKVDAEGDIFLPSGEYAASLFPPKELGNGGCRYTPAEKEWIRKMGTELTRRVNAYDELIEAVGDGARRLESVDKLLAEYLRGIIKKYEGK